MHNTSSPREWWRGCLIYQIYPRSFYDTSSNGIGDLKGITKKLEYITSLGVDAVWISPFFKSPMKDFGYDVSDYLQIDPLFGNIDDFKDLLAHAKELDIKVIIDQVWSHTSNEHEWFKQSCLDKTKNKTWLPIPDNHKNKSVSLQEQDKTSILNEYRNFIKWRKSKETLITGGIKLIDTPSSIIAYERTLEKSPSILCIFNSSDNKERLVLSQEHTKYKYITSISHNSIKKHNIIYLEPYGYAFTIKD